MVYRPWTRPVSSWRTPAGPRTVPRPRTPWRAECPAARTKNSSLCLLELWIRIRIQHFKWIRIQHFKWIRIRIQSGCRVLMTKTEEQKLQMNNFFKIKSCILFMSIQQEKTSASKKEHPALQKMKFINFFLCLWVIFALLDPDTVPGIPLNPDPIRIRIHSIAVYDRDPDPHFQDKTTFGWRSREIRGNN